MEVEEKPQLNVELISKVLKFIKGDPRRLEMRSFGKDYNILGHEHFRGDELPPCGTQACFAGWTVLLASSKERLAELWYAGTLRGEAEVDAQALLGFDEDEAYRVFYSGMTPAIEEQYPALLAALKTIYKNRGLEFKEPK